MRGSTGIIPGKRISSLVLGCALTLGLTACGDTGDDPFTEASGPPASGYSVQNALTMLPSHDDDGPLLIVTADLDAATEQSGLQRPTSFDDTDAVAAWLLPLSGVPSGDIEPAAVFVPFAVGFRAEYLLTDQFLPFSDELGWSVLDAASFAERQTVPHLFTVVSGDFGSETFPAELPEVADGVVTAGEGEDLEQNLQDRTGARPLGSPLRMAIQDAYLAAAPSTDEVSAWLDGSFASLAEDADLVAVAQALDDAGAISAVLSSGATRSLADHNLSAAALEKLKSDLAGAIPTDPFATVGIGWAIEDGESVITVAFKFADDDAANDALGAFEEMFTNAPTLMSGIPMSDLYSFQGAEAAGSVAVVTLTPGESGRINAIYQALMAYDLPFAYQ